MGWVKVMKESIRFCAPQFSMSRQVKDYTNDLYLPAGTTGRQMIADNYLEARALASWKERVYLSWPQVRISAQRLTTERVSMGHQLPLEAEVSLGSLSSDDVTVEAVWGLTSGTGGITEVHSLPLSATESLPGAAIRYTGTLNLNKNGRFSYGIRVTPSHPSLKNKHEVGLSKWA